ncbi:MAG TPA: isoleucine--tRNA ligase [Candidatus Moranbacteria bacterium]|nr:isoleucine--tRNA ligase [Candidatus Moranbacteria bacterium]HRY28044.1 isoleucine--tRNA ligase [Candidatus Moranbacteria bacterium]HSA07881.1 isoleucine--tRNA ligase [Candidatus Moranbacteria bacterium]
MAFKKVDPKQSFPKMEEEILKFWEENKIFEKSVEKNSADKSFVFYEGPPTANGVPGLHHVLARAFKDAMPRYKTMKGFRVERKAGWDTHGLPVELQVEKALGLKNKQDIENIVPGDKRQSIIEFNKKCKESVWEYKDLWEKLTRRMGYWVDMKNPYITYENKYIESVWWVIAQIFKAKNDKGESLVYKGHKVIPYCYRCGTALSSHEVAQGYQTVKDNSVYIKFKAKPNAEKGIDDDTYFLAWTTTPWTLPGNVSLAISPNVLYGMVKSGNEFYILAKDLIDKAFENIGHDFIRDIEAKELISLEYEPLYAVENKENKKAHYIIPGDFVTTTDGTGIVHIAPAFGEDDANVGKENNLPTLLTVDEEGKIIGGFNIPGEGIPVKKKNGAGKFEADELIVEDLKERKLWFNEEIYEHEYPFCWRCDTPLIYYAKPSWFIRMSEFSEDLVKNNENINWIPEYIKEGRFGEWLRGVKDWAISRERYWGTPLPLWQCECGETKVIESQKELEDLSGQKLDDLHKPFIDDVKIKCSCGKEMTRTPEVLDVWFDSGSMPLAQYHYPNGATKEDKQKVESGKYFPADFISEAIDQTRGWFYTLHAIANLLFKAGKVPEGRAFKNVVCLGLIVDAKGKKMSKSKGNMVDPMQVMGEYSADMLRYFMYTVNQPGMVKKFDVKSLKDIMNRVFRMLWNSYYFFVMYANIDKFEAPASYEPKTTNLLDKWIISELNILIKSVDEKLENYDMYNSAYAIEKFIDNLSNWYIRRSRKRFWKSEDDSDKKAAYETLHHVLITLSKLMAPFCPFISEEIYKNLTNEESVHLAEFPVADESLIDEKLNEEMEKTRAVITEALQLRAKAGIKVRQPLSVLSIKYNVSSMDLLEIIKDEINVKSVEVNEDLAENITLNTEITEDLKLEGQAREIVRFIQEMRKEAGYEVDNRIIVCYSGMSQVFNKFGELIAKEVLANELKSGSMDNMDLEKEVSVDGEKIYPVKSGEAGAEQFNRVKLQIKKD